MSPYRKSGARTINPNCESRHATPRRQLSRQPRACRFQALPPGRPDRGCPRHAWLFFGSGWPWGKELGICLRGRHGGACRGNGKGHAVARVRFVVPDFPASRAGVQVGDLIIAVDRVPVPELRLSGVFRSLRTVAGQTRVLRIEREGETLEIPIVLKPLL
ncbi:MAG: PDZ domain-containing protein [Gemmatimonadota bacterium]